MYVGVVARTSTQHVLRAPPNTHSMVARQCFVGEVGWAAG